VCVHAYPARLVCGHADTSDGHRGALTEFSKAHFWLPVCGCTDGARVELYQIRYFLALCETLNFARAAERCNVSQPSLTRAVQKLEQELGGLLIRRERRRTHLTELGELVQPMLKEVLSHSLSTVAAAKEHARLDKTVLRLGIMPSIGPVRLAPFLTAFAADHRDIELTLAEAPLLRLNDLLLGGHLDAAVVAYVNRPDSRFHYPSRRRATGSSRPRWFGCATCGTRTCCFAPVATWAISCWKAAASRGSSRESSTGARARTGSRPWSRRASASR